MGALSTVRASARLLLVAGLLVSTAVRPDPPEHYPFVNYDDGLRAARARNKPIMIYFGRVGCGWCEKTNREAFGDPAIRKRYSEHFVLVYVDSEGGERVTLPSGERMTEMELTARFKVFATPVFAFLEPDGREIVKVAGIQSARDLAVYDRFVTEGIYRTKTLPQFLSTSP